MSGRSDYLSAAFWAVLGVIVVLASWRLDRLENLHINPWSVPGLTPGVVGTLMILLALGLALQARGRLHSESAARGAAFGATPDLGQDLGQQAACAPGADTLRTLLAGVLCVLFAGVSLGRGLPFIAEGAAFIFLFTSAFSWSQWRTEGRIRRGLLMALAISVAASALISWLFESVFLVRLP